MPADLTAIIDYCNQRLNLKNIPDAPGIINGLQVANNGVVTHIFSAVDAHITNFEQVAKHPGSLLLVHHGLQAHDVFPVDGLGYRRIQTLLQHDIALLSAHLPLDCHREIGNNALIANLLHLPIADWIVPIGNTTLMPVCTNTHFTTDSLQTTLIQHFPRCTPILFGPKKPGLIAICSGSGSSVIDHAIAAKVDTLITGELKQSSFTKAQDNGLNLYVCGHYATETLGIDTLGREITAYFKLPYTFIASSCPL